MFFTKKDASISPYARNIIAAAKRRQENVDLTKGQSKAIMINECPHCPHYVACAGMVIDSYPKGQLRMPCQMRSDDTTLTWLSIRKDDRPSVKVGDRYGKLVVVLPHKPDDYGHLRWECKCECGKGRIIRGDNLLSGKTSSCGCEERKKSGSRIPLVSIEKKGFSDIVEFPVETNCVVGSLPSRPATGTESKCGRSIDVTLLRDQDGESYPFEVAGLCSECGGVIRFDDHGYKTCVECGVASSPVPDTSKMSANIKLTDVNEQYARLDPHESYGQIPDADLAKLMLIEEIAMSDYIDHQQGEWGSVQRDVFDPKDKHAPDQIPYKELCSPANKADWKVEITAPATTKQDEEHDYVAEFKLWCEDMMYAATHRPS